MVKCARAATGIDKQLAPLFKMADTFNKQTALYEKMKERRDICMTELEKIYDKYLWMNFCIAREKMELMNLKKSLEMLKEREENEVASLTEELRLMKSNLN